MPPKKSHINGHARLPLLTAFKMAFNDVLTAKKVPALHYGRQKWVSERYHVSTSAARKWVTGESLPDVDNMVLLADDLGCTVDELLGRRSLSGPKKTVAIPFRTTAPMGDTNDLSSLFGMVEFEEGILETAMRLRQNGLELFVVSTDSMATNINVGDIAFVDTAVKQIEDNRIYLFTSNNRSLLRRTIFNRDNTVRLLCDNTSYQETKVKLSDIQIGGDPSATGLRLIGEISWTIKKITGSAPIYGGLNNPRPLFNITTASASSPNPLSPLPLASLPTTFREFGEAS